MITGSHLFFFFLFLLIPLLFLLVSSYRGASRYRSLPIKHALFLIRREIALCLLHPDKDEHNDQRDGSQCDFEPEDALVAEARALTVCFPGYYVRETKEECNTKVHVGVYSAKEDKSVFFSVRPNVMGVG